MTGERERALEEIKVAYLESHDSEQVLQLEELVGRYPQYRDELVDFVTTFLELERAARRVPEPPEPSASVRRLREEAIRKACAPTTLREALAEAGASRQQAATAANVPVSFILRVERGRLIPDRDEPEIDRFAAKLGRILRRSADEVMDILRATFSSPVPRRQAGHLRSTGQPAAGGRRAPQSFRALLEGCEDLTPEQRSEWLRDQ